VTPSTATVSVSGNPQRDSARTSTPGTPSSAI
jgi:hypothetical protein